MDPHTACAYTSTAGNTYAGCYGDTGYARRTWFDAGGISGLVAALKDYDQCRVQLARCGGTAGDLQEISGILLNEITICGPYGSEEATLSAPESVKKALLHSGQYDLRFEVRRAHYGLPLYYLARTHHDWWGACGLLIEDLFRSEDFPLGDPRFAKLMEAGRGTYFVRLAPFREAAATMAGFENRDDVDNLLYTLGRCVFQGAWHVDQRFSFMVSDAFRLTELRSTIELLYMVLSVDLCALRNHLNKFVPKFFSEVYPNHALVNLIERLPDMNGKTITALSQCALDAYVEMTAQFNQFLRTTVTWRFLEGKEMPLWKLILANMKRLDVVSASLEGQPAMQESRARLLEHAEGWAQKMLAA